MFTPTQAFSGFSVDDTDQAASFYRDTLGLDVQKSDMGLEVALPGGGHVFVYPKPNHEPASFTVLNFAVDDIDAAVDDLNTRGVVTKIYADSEFVTDSKGISRGYDGPPIAWFRDPAGNVLAVLQQ